MHRLPKILFLVFLFYSASQAAVAIAQSEQVDEMDTIERISEWQDQLDADQMSQRDAAEEELIKIGSIALEHLDDPSNDMSSDKIERLARVRAKLETIAVKAASQPSMVTLTGELSVEESLKRIKKQTGNDVALSDNSPIEAGQKMIAWEGSTTSFWNTVTKIQQKAGLTIDPYAADGSKLRLMPSDPASTAFRKENPAVETTADMFHVQVTRVDAAKNLTHPNLDHASVQLLIRWEPRLRPITLKIPAQSVAGISSNEKPILVRRNDSVYSAMIQPQIPEVQLTIPLKPIPRDVEKIQSLTATIDATLPGRTETFRFRRIGKIPAGKKIARAGATVTFEGIEKNENLFGITLSLAFNEELNALESHQAWVFDNPIHLEDQQGQRTTPLTYESVRQDNSRVAITYYFADDPGEQTLVYQTAAAILQVQSKVELKDIPLP